MDYIAYAAEIFTAASIIVRLTPTKQDDDIMTKAGWLINLLFEKTRKK